MAWIAAVAVGVGTIGGFALRLPGFLVVLLSAALITAFFGTAPDILVVIVALQVGYVTGVAGRALTGRYRGWRRLGLWARRWRERLLV